MLSFLLGMILGGNLAILTICILAIVQREE